MRKVFLSLAVLSLLFVRDAGYSSGKTSLNTNRTVPSEAGAITTFVNSQVDTLIIYREPGISGLALAIHWSDSASITNCLLRRVIDGVPTGFTTTDSMFTGAAIVGRQDTALTKTITLAPLADQYWVIVTYAGSANGVTTPAVKYELQKQYAK